MKLLGKGRGKRGSLSNWKKWDGRYLVCNKLEGKYIFNVESVKVRRRVIAPYKIDGKPKLGRNIRW